MTPEDLRTANLRENPFRVTPTERVTVWAGHQDLRRLLEAIVTSVRNDKVGLTECVVLHGELGTGKSHALRFFQTFIELNAGDFRAPCVYLPTLRVASRISFLDLYRVIVRELGRERLRDFAKRLAETVTVETKRLEAATPGAAFKRAQVRGVRIQEQLAQEARRNIMGPHARRFKVFGELAKDSDEAWFFLSASETKWRKDALSRLEVTNGIDSDFEAIEHLSMLVNLTCGQRVLGGETYWKAFYLFLDEVEVLADLEPKAMVGLNQALRDLVNGCPEHLCMILGLTADAAMIELVFSQYVLSRLTREPIIIPSLSVEEALGFLRDVFKQYRASATGPDGWHPFTAESMAYIVENTLDKTPRRLFMNARRVLEGAAGEGLLSKGGKISKEDAERLLI